MPTELLAALSDSEVGTIVLIIALLCLAGAAYCAFTSRIPAAVALAVLAVLCFFLAS